MAGLSHPRRVTGGFRARSYPGISNDRFVVPVSLQDERDEDNSCSNGEEPEDGSPPERVR